MKILVISDSHIGQQLTEMPPEIVELYPLFDHIIHAGDITSYQALLELETLPNFTGVAGNMDDYIVKTSLPDNRILTLAGFRIGIAHGFGSKQNLAERLLNSIFHDEKLDILIHGHSHVPAITYKGSTMILNPGSVSHNLGDFSKSYAVLDLNENRPVATIIKF